MVRVPYKAFPDKYATFLYSAMLPVHLALPHPNAPRTKRFEAVIDSGASRCIFHADIGRFLGLDMKMGATETTQGIGGPSEIYLHDVKLYIPGGPVIIKAGFKESLPIAGLLGMDGFFEHFVVTFRHVSLECELDREYRA
jgi:hypothetical protein